MTKRDQSVSRFHAVVTAIATPTGTIKYVFKDTSTYGSFVGDKKVVERELLDGDKLYLGTCEEMLVFIRPPAIPYPEHEGMVYKKSNAFHKSWQPRWLCLYRDVLYYFKSKDVRISTST